MGQIKLPEDLSTLTGATELNRALHLGRIALDWSLVRHAPEGIVRELLAGLDLDRHGDAIGAATIPDELGDLVISACSRSPAREEEGDLAEPATPAAPVTPSPAVSPAQAAALREQLVEMVRADLLGPAGGDVEEVGESHVSDRYLVGMLAPRRRRPDEQAQDELALETSDEESGPAEQVGAAPSIFPSSMGLSFSLDREAIELVVSARWGHYQKAPSANAVTPTGQPKRVWKRRPAGGKVRLRFSDGPIEPVAPDPAQPK